MPTLADLDAGNEIGGQRKDYRAVAVRRRWSFLGPLFVCGLAGFLIGETWPLLYRSETLIIVEQQKVPEQYVISGVLVNLQHRLDTMKQQILSRGRLQRLIEENGLYPKERARHSTGDAVDSMRQRIDVELVQTPGRQGDLTGFRIRFGASDPAVAQRVTDQLTSMFIEENLRSRTQQAVATTDFLQSQLEHAQRDLSEQEAQLREYKLRYLGELPEQRQSNLQILSSLETQLHAATAALDRAEQQKIYFESLRSQYEALRISATGAEQLPSRDSATGAAPLTAAEGTLHELRRQEVALKAQYSDEHPDVRSVAIAVAEWESAVKRLRAELESAARTTPASVPNSSPVAGGLVEAESRLKASAPEIESQKREVGRLQQQIAVFQRRLNLTPVREQQVAAVSRSHDNAKEHYQSLLQKKLGSELAANLEKRQQGEQFRVLDPANLPKRPQGRVAIFVLGWLLGAGAGLGMVTLREAADHSVRSGEEILACLPDCAVVRIPVLLSAGELVRRRWRGAAECVAGVMLVVASAGAGARIYMAG